jgi:hypothetical protein
MLFCYQACRLKKCLEAGMLVASVEAGMAGKRAGMAGKRPGRRKDFR